MLVILNGRLDGFGTKAHRVLHLLNELRVHCQLARMVGEILVFGLVELVEGVTSQSIDVDALVRVSYEYFAQNVLRVRREELRQRVVSTEDLLV